MVLYRKYRPQKLSELDNEEVRLRLARIFSSAYTPHAFLFAGPKGTGKTSAARIIAKVLNCERLASGKLASSTKDKGLNANTIEPCNSCAACIAITAGSHMDILEIDAASNRGIEEIRDLREKIKLAPISARYKVYIIDEAHMLTREAFNALLKTLEEPPAHAMFILATTEAEKLPPTIISRCIRFNFDKATTDEIMHCLTRVVAGEKVSVSDEVLYLIAEASDGSFRDATKILEQAILENAISKDSLTKLLGREIMASQEILQLLTERKAKEILTQITKMAQKGIDFRFFVEDLLSLLHTVLLSQHGVVVNTPTGNMAKIISKTEVLALIKLFSRVYLELKNTSISYLPIEVAVVEWCENKEQY
ncbi:DNA polymerase III subunit gamma/tau [Candidatus Gottesmanbacteria bacterium]|nr:DNA polymerase III subunit gamma/tau [Candidatus Gottesmanbacteria bacterium]